MPFFFFPGQKYLIIFGALYVFLVALLSIPYFQSHALYLNAIRIPLFADYSAPELYGLAPNRTLNLNIQTPDNEAIGAWFVLSDQYYQSLPAIPANVSEHVIPALKDHPVILFLHGNAATRAFSARIQHYQAFSTRLGANVLAIDYRGFADSTGKPSEIGLTTDARTAFAWLVEHGKKPGDILIVGHSLGTGVSGQLGARLAAEGIQCKGIVLLSPFSSIHAVLETYHIFGFIPLMKPLALIPGAAQIIKHAVVHRFDTLQAVPNITASVLIAHAENDFDIPDSHSDALFEAFLENHLPPLTMPQNPSIPSAEEWGIITEQHAKRTKKRASFVSSWDIRHFGRVSEFVEDGGRKVTLVKTLAGGHDYLGVQEGLVDIIGKSFGLK